jgi:hypothetical protein
VIRLTLLLSLLALPAWAGDLPDSSLTPGVVRDDLSLQQICATKWGHDVRLVTAKMRNQVMAEYPDPCPSGKVEIDHLESRELGGADDVRNLWKQCYEVEVPGKKPSETPEFGAHKKDRLEDDFGRRICLPPSDPNYLPLETARNALRTNWVAAYIERFGDPRAQAAAH